MLKNFKIQFWKALETSKFLGDNWSSQQELNISFALQKSSRSISAPRDAESAWKGSSESHLVMKRFEINLLFFKFVYQKFLMLLKKRHFQNFIQPVLQQVGNVSFGGFQLSCQFQGEPRCPALVRLLPFEHLTNAWLHGSDYRPLRIKVTMFMPICIFDHLKSILNLDL